MDRAARRAAERKAVVDGDAEAARRLAGEAVAAGDELLAVVEEGFAAGIREVGRLWEEGEYFLPELVAGAEAMKAAMAVVQPALAASRKGGEPRGRVVIGTIHGDLHDIGKTLVGTLLSAHGYEVHDLGADVPIEKFVARAREVRADLIAASALLTTTMLGQRELVRAVQAAGFDRPVRVLVGGAPATPAWAAEIGAGYADSALSAVAAADRLMGAGAR
jgi:corrinoid protein of di/trimethylamine methyltransferase